MTPDTSLVHPKTHRDNPLDAFDERPPKHLRVHLRVGPSPHHTPAPTSSEHLASRARQKCRGAGTAAASFSVAAVPGPGAEPVAPCLAACAHPPVPDGLIAMDPDEIRVKDPSPAPCSAATFEPAATSNSMQCSLDALDATSHAIRLRLAAEERADKGTNTAYTRHVHNYVTYWDRYQAEMVADIPAWTSVPALPISAAKVLIFLDYERMREKKPGSSDTIPGSNVGKSVIQQAISALKDWRMSHHHLYLSVPEAQVQLRDDNRIRQIESAAKHDEPKRAESSQVLKASGTTSDAYTTEELAKCSAWCLTKFSGTRQVFVGLRDRAMLLFGALMALQGEGTRMLQLSDLFLSEVCIDDIQLGYTVPVLVALADNAKSNQHGRLDEHGTLRHFHVELCPVGALAMLFFACFHIVLQPVPEFSPEFSKAGYGEFGHRSWYDLYVFWGERPDKQMSYDNHYDRVKLIHSKNDISLTKAMHATRHFTTKTAVNDAFANCYDHALPLEGLLGAAMFNARKPEQYFLAWDHLEPPAELLLQIFPWVEQDDVFREFAAGLTAELARVNEEARLALQHLPEQYAQSMQGFVMSSRLAQEEANQKNAEQISLLHKQVSRLEMASESGRSGRRHREGAPPAAVVPPVALSPTVPPLESTTAVSSVSVSTGLQTGPFSLPMHPTAHPAILATSIIIPPPSVATGTATATTADLDARQQQWTSLVDRFGVKQLLKHGWEWVSGDYLPLYTFQPVTRITEVWDEYVAGLNGFLAVHDLDERWQAHWRRNISTLWTENCRRKKITALVETLARKPNWSVNLALHFLREKYETHPDLKKPRTFCEYLQKGGGTGTKDVLAAAANYP
ncbi:hypothetical protein EDD22DRAFT_961520 [Suillus occidentalis]|nr:hypothetical protein EDD22DRAFT_961520 [Suillus occidentalis]